MTVCCNTIAELANILRENGRKILNASSKLSLSSTLLYSFNQSVNMISNHTTNSNDDQHNDLKFIYDIFQETKALKLLPDFYNLEDNSHNIDLRLFKNLKLLEIKWLSLKLVKGIKNIRTHLEYLSCMHSLNELKEVLERCGADNCHGFTWNKLREAVFSYNNLCSLDNSLEFTPWLCSLDLSHNNLYHIEFLCCLPKLSFLNLSYNKLERVPCLKGEICKNLKTLILQNNLIDDILHVSLLCNLETLDIRNNCLSKFSALLPLSHLFKINKLYLNGNPLFFHHNYRQNIVQYLSINHEKTMILDNLPLSASEKCLLGKKCVNIETEMSGSQVESLDSLTSENTVIPNVQITHRNIAHLPISNACSLTIIKYPECVQNNSYNDEKFINSFLNKTWPVMEDRYEKAMNDSGIVAENRPETPSICSIGSASSLNGEIPQNIETTFSIDSYESDIEILSSSSKSSIEILHRSFS